MVKHTQTILSVFDHFVKLASKGLRKYLTVKKVSEEWKKNKTILNMVGFPDPSGMIIYKNLKSHLIFFSFFLLEMVKQKLKLCLVFSMGQRKFTTRTNVSRTNHYWVKYVVKGFFSKDGNINVFNFCFTPILTLLMQAC